MSLMRASVCQPFAARNASLSLPSSNDDKGTLHSLRVASLQREKDALGMLQKSRKLVSGLLSLVGVSMSLTESHPANPRLVHVEQEMLLSRTSACPDSPLPACAHPYATL